MSRLPCVDLDAAIEWYGSALVARIAHRERVERDGVEEALLCVAESYIQLLCLLPPLPVARFLERKGEGIHMSATGWPIVPRHWTGCEPQALS